MAAWEVIQGFYDALPQLDATVLSKTFNLATESYGGHYGPAFFNYFQQQNILIANGSKPGIPLTFDSLTIINGIVSEKIQAPYFPVMATNNSYGIVAYNESIYNYSQIALYMPNGCLSQLENCDYVDRNTLSGKALCTEATNMCRDNVEGLYYAFGVRGTYDIRHPSDDPTPPDYFVDYLNQPEIQQALVVDTNYSSNANDEIYFAFQQTGDFVYPDFLTDLEMILNSSVRVALIYGDADYICKWTSSPTRRTTRHATGKSIVIIADFSNLKKATGTEAKRYPWR